MRTKIHCSCRRVMPRFVVLAFSALVLGARLAIATTWYVDVENASGVEDGTSWATAFTTIQPAIDATFADGGGEVWVAKGLYSESRTFVAVGESLNRGSLVMRDGVELYGGFAGTEDTWAARDFEVNATVIDGSTSVGGEPAKHVVYAVADARIDGFTISGGSASGDIKNAGGIFCGDGDARIFNCKIKNNFAELSGGGLLASNANVQIVNCDFSGNASATNGGGISIGLDSHLAFRPIIQNCQFRDNVAETGGGGAIISGEIHVKNCSFLENSVTSTTTGAGGGAIWFGGDSTIENCLFIGNKASSQGGAITCGGSFGFGQPPNPGYSTIARLLNCTFVDNSAPEGGAISYGEVLMAMVNCVEWENGPDAWAPGLGGAGLVNINISHSIVSADTPESFTDDYEGNLRVDPRFVAPELGNYRLRPESPAVDGGTAAETIVPNNVPDFDVDAPTDDIEGTTRPIGEAHDMGAYEFDPEAFVDPLDPSGDGLTNAVDIQMVINGALGAACDTCDINLDGIVDAVDVQSIINVVLGTV